MSSARHHSAGASSQPQQPQQQQQQQQYQQQRRNVTAGGHDLADLHASGPPPKHARPLGRNISNTSTSSSTSHNSSGSGGGGDGSRTLSDCMWWLRSDGHCTKGEACKFRHAPQATRHRFVQIAVSSKHIAPPHTTHLSPPFYVGCCSGTYCTAWLRRACHKPSCPWLHPRPDIVASTDCPQLMAELTCTQEGCPYRHNKVVRTFICLRGCVANDSHCYTIFHSPASASKTSRGWQAAGHVWPMAWLGARLWS